MNDFAGLLSSGYGFKSSRNSPMSSSKPPSSSSNSNPTPFKPPSTYLDDHDALFRPISAKNASDFSNLGDFDGVFKPSSKSASSVNLDAIFGGGGGGGGGEGGDSPASRFSSLPVFDKPVYDDDVSSSSHNYDDLFGSNSVKKSGGGGGGGGGGGNDDAFGDLLGVLGRKEAKTKAAEATGGGKGDNSDFDDLLPGFGGSSPINRSSSDTTKKPSSVLDDPFVVLESTSPPVSSSSRVFNDPLDEIENLNNSGRKKFEDPSSGGVFDDIDPLDGFAKSVPPFSTEANGKEKDESPLRTGSEVSGRQNSANADVGLKSSVSSPERGSEKKMPVGDVGESPHSVFEVPSMSVGSNKSATNASSPVYGNSSSRESYSRDAPEENTWSSDEVWLTVSEIPLFTQPTAAPPPSRPPPPRPARFSRADSSSYPASNAQRRANDYSSRDSSNPFFQSPKSSFASPIDELEEFAMGTNQSGMNESSDVHSGEDFDSNSAAAAMKEAMDRAEVKFRYARGVREREHAKASRSRESVQVDREVENAEDRDFREGQERLERDRQQRQREEEGRRREEEERRRIEKEQEEKEKEKRRIERERELARQAVDRVAREARERAAIEARTRADRVAVQKAQAEARERAARAAVQKAQAEARERAAANAKERAEKAAAEAKEKARAEAREREAREREAAAARGNQQKTEPDLDSIFGTGSRASSAPRPRANSSDPFETQFQSQPGPDGTRTSVNSASTMRKASSSTNIVDDLSSIFGGPPSSSSSPFGVFQEVEGETEDRRRARFDREQRTQERAAKALAEKNARDLEVQREQAERHRIAETLDIEIKRWAAGKEGNLRALLSTMQYVLWPECGWQPVSLTDLITGAAVKKVYRKATLCIHPDKVQQKGATLQQKYVAEKVFDLLKEAWNKFNSEELF